MTCDNGPLRHKHHIIPRYKGGSDEPTNLVEVSITQHAMYHFCNYQLWGNAEDYVAWRGLSGQISEQEFLVEKLKIFSQKGLEIIKKRREEDPEFSEMIKRNQKESWNKNREKNLEKILSQQPLAVEAARTPENIEKKKRSLALINHQQGDKNSQYGTIWITNGTKEGSYRINKTDPIPEGFRKGRISRSENSIEYNYVITTPDNEIIKTKYLCDFCELNGLTNTHMYAVANGKKKHHKGYRVYKEPIRTTNHPTT